MAKTARCFSAIALVVFGYVLGATGLLSPKSVRAQAAGGDELQPETLDKLKAAFTSVRDVSNELGQLGRYDTVTGGVNFFAVSVGGVNAKDDLEKGRGVDPETFAALYADEAIDEIRQHIDRDDQGRLTYKSKVVRMYPISRLKQMYQLRKTYSQEANEKKPAGGGL